MRRSIIAVLIVLIAIPLLVLYMAYNLGGVRLTEPVVLADLTVPEGFTITVFADNLGGSRASYPGPNAGPRFMAYHDDVLITSLMKQGEVVALPDRDKNGVADEIISVATGLNNPHGLDVVGNELYIAEEHQVIKGTLNAEMQLENIEVVIRNIPTGGIAGRGHFTRSIVVDGNDIYLSVGSSCNVCEEKNEWRATVLKCTDGECGVFASGLRNSVGIVQHPFTGELWGTDNGRDLVGNDVPPEEINLIEEGKDYGWPTCYGNKINDRDFDDKIYIISPCEFTEAPKFEMQAHSAPLGLRFYFGNMYPPDYQGDLFVAFHGSWNRDPATGYKVVRVKFEDGGPASIEDFATGWLQDSKVTGRPVDVIVAPDGSLLVSDDSGGKIYRISYEE